MFKDIYVKNILKPCWKCSVSEPNSLPFSGQRNKYAILLKSLM